MCARSVHSFGVFVMTVDETMTYFSGFSPAACPRATTRRRRWRYADDYYYCVPSYVPPTIQSSSLARATSLYIYAIVLRDFPHSLGLSLSLSLSLSVYTSSTRCCCFFLLFYSLYLSLLSCPIASLRSRRRCRLSFFLDPLFLSSLPSLAFMRSHFSLSSLSLPLSLLRVPLFLRPVPMRKFAGRLATTYGHCRC